MDGVRLRVKILVISKLLEEWEKDNREYKPSKEGLGGPWGGGGGGGGRGLGSGRVEGCGILCA